MNKFVILSFLLVIGVFHLVSGEEVYQKEKIDSIRNNSLVPVIYLEGKMNLLHKSIFFRANYLAPTYRASKELVLKLMKASLPLNPGLNPKKIPALYPVLLNMKDALHYTENVYVYSRNDNTLEYIVENMLEKPAFPILIEE